MSHRVTEQEIYQALKILNDSISHTGYKILKGGRYGYQALDLYKVVPGREWGDCISTIRTGMTKSECLMCVHSMLDGISIYKKEKDNG